MKPKILVLANQKCENYISAVLACGGEAITSTDAFSVEESDGLLLCGGNDIHPSYYGQDIRGAKDFDLERDRREFEIAKAFIDTGKPVFGICRGMQLLNVALGGTLIQHLKDSELHVSRDGVDARHKVSASGILSDLYGQDFVVNSSHHQAIERLGAGLFACANYQGVIEAVQHESGMLLGVQFHPERMCLDYKSAPLADGIKLFNYFISICKKKSV